MYKTALKKSVLLVSLALSAAAPAVDLNQHLSFDYRIPGDSIGDLRTGLTANACHSLTDPMVIRLSLADVDWKQYDVNLKINGQPINAVMTPFKQDTDLVKPFLVSADNKLTDQFVTADQELKSHWAITDLELDGNNAYCFTNQQYSANSQFGDEGAYYNTGGYPPYGLRSDLHKAEWEQCKDRVVKAVCEPDKGCYYPENGKVTVAGSNALYERLPIVYDHYNKSAPEGLLPSEYKNDEYFAYIQTLMKRQLEIARRHGISAYTQAQAVWQADHFWYKYMFYRHATSGIITSKYENGQKTIRKPASLLGLTLADIDADKALKPSVDYTPAPYAPSAGTFWDNYNGDRIVNHYLAGNVNYYTSQRNIQSIELTVTRKGAVPVTHSFKWTRYGTGDMKKNVLLPSHTGDLVKPSAEQYAADYYQKQGFYATTPGFYRGTLIASDGLNTKYTNNPAPLSRPAGINGSINLVNTNDLTLRLTEDKATGEINALFYGQPLQFADLKFGEQKITAKKIREVCY